MGETRIDPDLGWMRGASASISLRKIPLSISQE
jgi:hypothetical protein